MKTTTRRRWLLAPALLLVAALALFAFACGDDDGDSGASEAEIQEIESLVQQLFESSGAEVDFVLDNVTDNLIATAFFTTREECRANADDCIGDPAAVEGFTGTSIDGDTASTTVMSDFATLVVGLVRVGDAWLVDSLGAVSDELPEGAATVDLSLSEFAFSFDAAEVPADGNFGFAVSNDGQQDHEVGFAPIPDDVTLEEALELPTLEESVVGLKLFIAPGQEVNMAFEAPLEAGRYIMVCFFPDTDDPEGTPHVFKGMLSEFTVQ